MVECCNRGQRREEESETNKKEFREKVIEAFAQDFINYWRRSGDYLKLYLEINTFIIQFSLPATKYMWTNAINLWLPQTSDQKQTVL